MGRSKPSLRSKAVHLVSDFTTVILNPISDRSSTSGGQSKEKVSGDPNVETDSSIANGPDTSSFGAFLVSLLTSPESASPESASQSKEESDADDTEMEKSSSSSEVKGKVARRSEGSSPSSDIKGKVTKKSMFARGKRTLGKVMHKAVRISGYGHHKSQRKIDSSTPNETAFAEQEMMPMNRIRQSAPQRVLPDISEPSLLLYESMRHVLYGALPLQVEGRNWVLLYSTWRHGISLSTLYRRSLLCPGYCLLVVGDQKGAVFGGLVEAPLMPSNMRYQGSNSTFVFTNLPSSPVVFRATGANRYFTLCSSDFLALGGGGHFALYLDGELLNGSSFASETYGNSCLAHTEEFDVKEVELWGFVYASKCEETLEMCRMDAPGISRWTDRAHDNH